MRHFLFISALLVSLKGYPQNNTDTNFVYTRVVKNPPKYTDTEYWGEKIIKSSKFNEKDSIWEVSHFYITGQLNKIEIIANDGYTDAGPQIGYNPDSSIAFIMPYKNGWPHGTFKEFYRSGKIKKTGQLYNRFKSGTWKTYNENGQIIDSITYNLTQLDSTHVNSYEETLPISELKIIYGFMPKIIPNNEHYDEDEFIITQKFFLLEPKK